MKIKLNGSVIAVSPASTLMEFINKHVVACGSYAIALNQHFIPRAQYDVTILCDYDEVNVIQPMQGG